VQRFNVGRPVPLRQLVTDENENPIAASGTLTFTRPDGTTGEGVVQSGGQGVLDVTLDAADVTQLGRYSYVWRITAPFSDAVPGVFYVALPDMDLPPLADFEQFVQKLGYRPEGAEAARADELLMDASELAREAAGMTWANAATGALLAVPRRVRGIVLEAAYRAFGNPEALSQRTIGDSSKAYHRTGVPGGEAVYLTPGEKDAIRKAAGGSSFASVGMTMGGGVRELDPWDEVTLQ